VDPGGDRGLVRDGRDDAVAVRRDRVRRAGVAAGGLGTADACERGDEHEDGGGEHREWK
jgi:hypothetical protein